MDAKKRKLEENGEAGSEMATRSLMEPLSKEQLMDILQEAAVQHPSVLSSIMKLADKEVAHRKLFVRGLGLDTTSEALKVVFSEYGEIEESLVIVDKNTGKGKGYGFVTFAHRVAAHKALQEPSKRIAGRMSVCQLASAGPSSQSQPPQLAPNSRKIYVGNVPHELSAERLLSVFSQYGDIEEGPLGYDKQTGKSRGFALFIYKSSNAVKHALEEPTKNIDGHQVTCKLAEGHKRKPETADIGLGLGLGLGFPQAAGIVGPNPNPLAGLLPLNQGILGGQHLAALAAQGMLSSSGLAALNASLYPSVAHQLAMNPSLGSTLNSSLNPSLTPSLPSSLNGSLSQGALSGLSQAYGQVSSSMGLSTYGLSGLGVYGSQVAGLGGTGAVADSLYGLPTSSQTGQPSGAHGHSFSSYYTN